MFTILPAQTGDALEGVITLAQEYVTWMIGEIRVRYPDLDIAEFASEHTYDDVRKKFPGDHVPPDGCLRLAQDGAAICGCVALGRLTDTICEVRTLYVRPDCRGQGIGRQLARAALDAACGFGYSAARLDTLAFMEGAQALYRSLGFTAIEPYLDVSESLKRYIRFFELKLTD